MRRPGDLVIVSLHWGPNWGYSIRSDEIEFARRMIDEAGADLVHGHSSHHAKGMEIHRGRVILYGCGDLLNDYEGIGGHERFRPHLAPMYFPRLNAGTGELIDLGISVMRIRQLRLERASAEDAEWIADRLIREGAPSSGRLSRQGHRLTVTP